MTWVPPGGGVPVSRPPAADPVAPAGMPPAPAPAVTSTNASPASIPAVALSASPGVRTPVLVAVIGSIVIGSLIGGIGTGISMANRPAYPSYPSYPSDPLPTDDPVATGDYSTLAVGDPGPATAVEPTVCNTTCFGEKSAEAAMIEDSIFTRWYMPQASDVWSSESNRTTADAAYVEERNQWVGNGISPEECFVTWSDKPIVEPFGSPPGPDVIAPYTQHFSTQYPRSFVSQSVRFFPDSDSAEQYMLTLDAGLDACTRYKDPNGYALDTVTREPALHPPDNVAAVGFVRSEASIRYYVMDLQRANMVIRTVAYSDGGIDDDRFRPLMQQQAFQLGDIDPLG